MINRINTGVLLFKNDKILLVKHVDPNDGYEFWVPPGGGVQESESIHDAAKREVYEETGLDVDIQETPIYIRQFISKTYNQNNLTLYLIGTINGGIGTIKNIIGKGEDEQFIKELRYFNKEEIQKINAFPKMLKDQLWKDKEQGFTTLQFIGVEKDFE